MLLNGRCALIPGASRPIGRAIANKFGSQGASLILPVFDWPDSIVEMEEEFRAANYTFRSYPVDLRSQEEIAFFFKAVKTQNKRLDFLINNIERGGMPVVHGGYDQPHNKDQWNLEFDTTLKAKWLLFHYFFPLMKDQPGGAVINISSIAGITGRSGPAASFFNDGYSAANRAVQSFTESWAKQAAPNIRVNELMLGFFRHRHGEGTRGWEVLTNQEKNNLHKEILLQRTGLPDEVAATVYFLAVEASYITGATLRMDGGYVLGASEVPPLPEGILK